MYTTRQSPRRRLGDQVENGKEKLQICPAAGFRPRSLTRHCYSVNNFSITNGESVKYHEKENV